MQATTVRQNPNPSARENINAKTTAAHIPQIKTVACRSVRDHADAASSPVPLIRATITRASATARLRILGVVPHATTVRRSAADVRPPSNLPHPLKINAAIYRLTKPAIAQAIAKPTAMRQSNI
jgi:hypothetical protein